MWFNNLMDDLKKAFLVSNEYRGVFVPVFLKLAMNIIVGILIVVGIITSMVSGAFAGADGASPIEVATKIIGPALFYIGFAYLIYIILASLIEVGSINIYKVAIDGRRPEKSDFTGVIKNYIARVISGKLLIHFLVLILLPIIIVVYVIYMILIGIITSGWGLIALSVIIDMYFAVWTIAIVNDDMTVIKSLKHSFRFARRNFKTMFVLLLSSFMIIQYTVTILGPFGAFFVGWFIGGVLRTFFKIATYITYLRYNEVQSDSEY